MKSKLIEFRSKEVWVSDSADRLIARDDNGTYEMAFLHPTDESAEIIRWLGERMIPTYLERAHCEWMFARIIDPVVAFEARTRWT